MSTAPRKRLYFPHVEGLRGLTALYVFLFHLRLAVVNISGFAGIVSGTAFLGYGHYAVSIFIVISGYCLGAPIAHRPEEPFDAWAFAKRRFRRIYPAYFAALVLSLAAFFYWSAAAYHHVPPLKNEAIAFVAHAALIHNLFEKTRLYLNGPMWSVGIESQIYVVFALLLVPLWRRFGVGVQLAVALVLGLLPHFAFHGALDDTCPWFLGLFAMGVVAAALSERRSAMTAWRIGAALLVIATIAVVVIANVNENSDGYGPFWWTDVLVGLALSVFFVAAADEHGTPWAPAKLLAFEPIVRLGTFAYSIYLLHWPMINVLRETLRRVHAGPVAGMIAYACLVPVVLGVSYVFFRLLERPFMSSFLRRTVDQAPAAAAEAAA